MENWQLSKILTKKLLASDYGTCNTDLMTSFQNFHQCFCLDLMVQKQLLRREAMNDLCWAFCLAVGGGKG